MRREAGTVLRAIDALNGGQGTFTRSQVAYLLHLAFESGIRYQGTFAEGEMLAGWTAHHDTPPSRKERIAAELATVDHRARIRAERQGRPYRIHPGGPVDWETGRPIRRLETAA